MKPQLLQLVAEQLAAARSVEVAGSETVLAAVGVVPLEPPSVAVFAAVAVFAVSAADGATVAAAAAAGGAVVESAAVAALSVVAVAESVAVVGQADPDVVANSLQKVAASCHVRRASGNPADLFGNL